MKTMTIMMRTMTTGAALTLALSVMACGNPCDKLSKEVCAKLNDEKLCTKFKEKAASKSKDQCKDGLKNVDALVMAEKLASNPLLDKAKQLGKGLLDNLGKGLGQAGGQLLDNLGKQLGNALGGTPGAPPAPGAAPAAAGPADACLTTAVASSDLCKTCCTNAGKNGHMWTPDKCRCM